MKKRKTKERLEGLINSEISDIENEVLSEEEKDKSIERIGKYTEILNKSDKRESRRRTIETAMRVVEVVSVAFLGFATLIAGIVEFNEGLEFEKTGTVSSIFVRNRINKNMRK